MPEVTGQEMLVKLRESQPLIPVLVISGTPPAADDLAALYDIGASAVLPKPFDETMIFAIAHGLLRPDSGKQWMR